MMGKFKVGDRVTRTGGGDFHGVKMGETYTVRSVSNGWIGLEEDSKGGPDDEPYDVDNFQLAEPKWQPKVGDRVRFTDKCKSYWWFGPSKEAKEGVVTSGRKYGFDFSVRTSGIDYAYVNAEHIELIALTIEAGKFYKTRDGRKVGPVVINGDIAEARGNSSFTCVFANTGFANFEGEHNDDFIAEWVDEPVAATPKFKKGDRVIANKNSYSFAFIAGCEYVVTDASIGHVQLVDSNGVLNGWTDSNFDLAPLPATAIVALIENGFAKPATKPKVHADQTAATTEAERLALEHPGQTFGVFILADSKIADIVTTQTAVLRAA